MRLLVISVLLVGGAAGSASAQQPQVDALAQAARASRSDYNAQRAYGMALLRAGRYREAQQTLQAASRLSRDSAEAAYDAARPVFATGNYRASLGACRAVERFGRDAAWARVCRARAYLVWNRSARAFEELEAAVAAEPSHFEAQLALGDAHRLRAAVAEAEAAYRRATALRAQSAEPHLGLGRLYAAANRRDDAIRELREALRLDADNPEIQFELGQLMIAQGGGEQFQEGGLMGGLALLRRAVTGRPTWAIAQSALGDALLARGEIDEAHTAYQQAASLDSRLAAAQVGLGRTLTAKGQHEEAEAALRRALELVPNSGEAVIALADLFQAAGRNEEAFAEYRRAAGLDPLNPAPLIKAAKLALRLRRDVLAAGFLDRVLERHPNLAVALMLYGDVMSARSNRTEARQYYQRAMNGQGRFDRAHVQTRLRELGGR